MYVITIHVLVENVSACMTYILCLSTEAGWLLLFRFLDSAVLMNIQCDRVPVKKEKKKQGDEVLKG